MEEAVIPGIDGAKIKYPNSTLDRIYDIFYPCLQNEHALKYDAY